MLALFPITMLSQSKIDLYGQALMRQYRSEWTSLADSTLSSKAFKMPDSIAVFVKFKDNADISKLDKVKILDSKGDLAIVRLPLEYVDEFSKNQVVQKIEFGKKAVPKLNQARSATGVDMVHKGYGLPSAYTGKGIITGLFDTGLDPNHITFYNSEQNESRIKRVWRITGQNGLLSNYDTAEKIAGFTTDNTSSTHGTHVAGIMSGSYSGNDYYGVAPESEIVMACGDLYDSNIILGASRILEYAKEQGKRAVINLSLGVNSGPHDGTDYFSRYLDEIGEDAIICISAGNEGALPIVARKEFKENDTQLKTLVKPFDQDGIYIGSADCWTADETPVSVTPIIYDLTSNQITYQMPSISESTNGNWTYISSQDYYEEGDLTDEAFDEAFVGYMGCASIVVEDNNRYEVMVYYNMKNASGNDGRYIPGFIIDGNPGQRIDSYSDGSYLYFSNYDVDGWNNGVTDGTINNMACGKNVIVVGSFDSANSFTTNAGYTASYPEVDINVGMASTFSSYGTLVDGRKLPHILAPGCIILSAYSTPYVDYAIAQGLEKEEYMAAIAEGENRKHYWGAQLGTSMSTPFMSGAAALWLQADSTLSVSDILNIAQETAADVDSKIDPIQCGAGKLSVFNGLKNVLNGLTGIGNITESHSSKVLLTPINETDFGVYVADDSNFKVLLHDMSGRIIRDTNGHENEAEISTSGLEKGIYILSIAGDKSRYSSRILVK